MATPKKEQKTIYERPERPEIQTGNFNKRSNSALKRVVKQRNEAIERNKRSSNTQKGVKKNG